MSDRTPSAYELYYWPSIQGRGELVRLLFAAAQVAYADIARRPEEEGGGVAALMRVMRNPSLTVAPLAPPFVRVDGRFVAQTATIGRHLAPRFGLVPDDEGARLHADQLALTLLDLLEEVHQTHHPIAGSLYYEDQKAEAARRAACFRDERLEKYLGYFDRVLERSDGPWLLGSKLSYVDLWAFQMVCGLEYAFPRALARERPRLTRLMALHKRVAALESIAAYLAGEQRIAFNEHGIFRHYPELDG